jgi:predicted amidohydrolase YtcJ
MSKRTLITNAAIYAPSVPFATAMLIDGEEIVWIGDHSGAEVHRELADTVIHAQGHFLAPGFVDAHVHATSTGIMLSGLDLTQVTNKTQLLNLLSDYAKHLNGGTVLGHGWDETNWSDPELPTRIEIDRATWGSVVYLSRVDVHSALVSNSLVAQLPASRELTGFDEGPVTQLAHGALRTFALGSITSGQRSKAQETFFSHALSHGIVSVHEMAGPHISSHQDARSLKELASQAGMPHLAIYWGELFSEHTRETISDLEAIGAGGDLFIDGAIGSRTAFLHDPYTDNYETHGANYLNVDQVAHHLIACTQAGIQGGFHVIGDQACEIALKGARLAAAQTSESDFRRLRHRLEHAEMLTDDHIETMRTLGMSASMQPLFDAWWGNPGGMYESRLGDRSQSMNRWGSLQSHGTAVCFSSDSPVTPNTPWNAVHAAMHHHNAHERISGRAAFAAHTRGGWRALGPQYDSEGVIEVGATANLATWHVEDYQVHVPDSRVTQWSTDPRSATVPLPNLGEAESPVIPLNVCTIVKGKIVFLEESFSDRVSTNG